MKSCITTLSWVTAGRCEEKTIRPVEAVSSAMIRQSRQFSKCFLRSCCSQITGRLLHQEKCAQLLIDTWCWHYRASKNRFVCTSDTVNGTCRKGQFNSVVMAIRHPFASIGNGNAVVSKAQGILFFSKNKRTVCSVYYDSPHGDYDLWSIIHFQASTCNYGAQGYKESDAFKVVPFRADDN